MDLSSDNYIIQLVQKFSHLITSNKIQRTPLTPNVKLSKPLQPHKGDFPFREIIGACNYITCLLRIDLSFSTNYLARFMDKYDETHIEQLLIMLAYMRDNSRASIKYYDLNMHYRYFTINGRQLCMSPNCLYCFVDADFASYDLEQRRSTTGYIIFFNGGPISWKTMKQKRTAGSSTEAEYIALYEAVKETIWLKNILSEIILFEVPPVIIYEDNSSTIRASENLVEHSKLKHMEIDIHAIRDYISSNHIIMQKIVSVD